MLKSKYFLNRSNFADFILGLTAFIYMAGYITLKGTLAGGPILICALLLLVYQFFKPANRKLDKHDYAWIYALVAFGSWGVFSVWYHEAGVHLYEEPTKFIIAGIMAIAILRQGINLNWIKFAIVAGTIGLVGLAIYSYEGGRFSPLMNATKFGNAIAFQAALALALSLVEKSNWQKMALIAAFAINTYLTVLTGTRGAMLGLVAATFVILALLTPIINWKTRITLLAIIGLSGAFISNSSIFETRLHYTVKEVNQIFDGNYRSSIGYRLVMAEAGIQAGMRHPIVGQGYDYSTIFEDFQSSSENKLEQAKHIGKYFNNFHNVYIDSLAKRGFVGLTLLILVLAVAVVPKSKNLKSFLLTLTPALTIAIAGLSDSVFELGITTSYFVLATTILKATELPAS